MASSIFIAELTDKDALLILALSTRIKPFIVFVSGLVAFTITTAVVVTIGDFLLSIFPVDWITLSGAVIMIGYGIWLLLGIKRDGEDLTEEESNLLARSAKKNALSIFLRIVPMLVLLDLAGDATVILTIIFVADLRNTLLVFTGAVTALAAATAMEVVIGNRLTRIFSLRRIRLFSPLVFLAVGTVVIILTVFY